MSSILNFKSLDLKKAYNSDTDDILNEFYIPTLELSVGYQRLAGYFSSTSFAVSARGITGLINNGGNMELVVSPKLKKEDLEIIMKSLKTRNEVIAERMITDLEMLEDSFITDHVLALCWMISEGRLDIKVAIPFDSAGNPIDFQESNATGLFHQKVGILHDQESNFISFSGSVNESASGWLTNIEEFKVFCSWNETEVEYLETDIAKFSIFWEDKSRRIQTIDVPTAVKNKLISMAPNDFNNIDLISLYKKRKLVKPIKLYKHHSAWLSPLIIDY